MTETDEELLAALRTAARERPGAREVDAVARYELEARGSVDPEVARALGPFTPVLIERLVTVAEAGLRKPRARSARGWSVAAALLAASVVWVLLPGTAEELPAYGLEVTGGDQSLREAPERASSEMPWLSAGSTLTVVARPATTVRGQVAARAFVEGGAAGELVGLPLEIAGSGTVRLVGKVGEGLPASPGEHVVVLVVAPADVALPNDLGGLSGADERWRVLRARYRISAE